tara:strand:- start:458 stop:817 length:360 start_codon:yes stop_codon:yes gene_type:complete
MDDIQKYLKSRKKPTPADKELAKAYENFTQPKTAKQLLDYTFTAEYQKFVRDFWAQCHDEFVKAQAAKKEDDLNLGLPPKEAAKLRKAAEIKIKEQGRLSKEHRIKEEEAYQKDMAQYD